MDTASWTILVILVGLFAFIGGSVVERQLTLKRLKKIINYMEEQ